MKDHGYQAVHTKYGWTINRHGVRVAGYFNQDSMQTRLDKLIKAANVKSRPCLCCGIDFLSEGPHNRLCKACRHGASDLLDPFSVGSKRGRL